MNIEPLVVHDLAKAYRTGLLGRERRMVLDGLELELQPGERVLVAGPNGSGKSTLLRILAGIEAADRGTVRVFGRPISERAARRSLAYAADRCPYPDELRGLEALVLAGRLAGLERGAARTTAAAALERVGLGADGRRRLGVYSKGMRRRFHLAQAFLAEPLLLLLDEPADGLDAEGCLVLEELLAEARARNAAVLMASHLTSLECDRALVLAGGRVAWSGSGSELATRPGGLLGLYGELARCSATD
jgi:ABC-type multidrug transport system ATPase subunit